MKNKKTIIDISKVEWSNDDFKNAYLLQLRKRNEYTLMTFAIIGFLILSILFNIEIIIRLFFILLTFTIIINMILQSYITDSIKLIVGYNYNIENGNQIYTLKGEMLSFIWDLFFILLLIILIIL